MKPSGNPYYRQPGHPLYEVPRGVLDAGRSAIRAAVVARDVDPDLADSIADMVIVGALPALRRWLSDSRC